MIEVGDSNLQLKMWLFISSHKIQKMALDKRSQKVRWCTSNKRIQVVQTSVRVHEEIPDVYKKILVDQKMIHCF